VAQIGALLLQLPDPPPLPNASDLLAEELNIQIGTEIGNPLYQVGCYKSRHLVSFTNNIQM
jgi:hypothetical protein